jgi:hypothetical protein
MAGEDFSVLATRAAAGAIEELGAEPARATEAFETEPRKQGCKVAGYRLLPLFVDRGVPIYALERCCQAGRTLI